MQLFPRRPRAALAALFAPLVLAPAAAAQVVVLEITLDGRQATPPATSDGTGTGTVTVDTAADTITFDVGYSGTSLTTVAHLHGPADPDEFGGVIVNLLEPNSPITGTYDYDEADEAALLEGRTFINVHTTAFPGGEIRGQLMNADTYCWGDGSATPCPCGNGSLAGRGCVNSTGRGGLLLVTGNNAADASNDSEFFALNLLPDQPALLFMGQNQVGGGDGVVFGDGLRCAGGSVVRLGVAVPDAAGLAVWTPALDGSLDPGDVRNFQGWYRDPSGSPCADGFNLTNGLSITFR